MQRRQPQGGAALIVSVVLVAVVSLLSAAAMHAVTLETLMTAHLAAHTQARLSAASAIDLALASDTLPPAGETRLTWQLGPDDAYAAAVTIRWLGETTTPADVPDVPAGSTVRHYEILAEVRGPRATLEQRRRYLQHILAATSE